MNWIALILISVLFTSISSLLQRVLLKDAKHDPIVLSVVFQLVTGLLLGTVGLIFYGLDFSGTQEVWPNLLVLILLYGFGNAFVFKSLSQIEASNFIVIFSLRAFVTMVTSFILLGQQITGMQIFGSLLIFGSVVLVNLKSAKFSFKTPEILAIGAAICFGLANTNDKVLLDSIDLYPYLILAFILPAILIAALNPRKMTKLQSRFNRKDIIKILILCFVYAIGSATFFSALQQVDIVSKVTTVSLTSVILTVLLSVIILQEKKHLLAKLIGAILCFAGLVMISVG